MATNNLGLEQPIYLSDGETAVNAMNANMTKIDVLISAILWYEGEILMHDDELVISVL